MHDARTSLGGSCHGDCGSCSVEPLRLVAENERPPLAGWRLVLNAALVFLLPLLTGITGAGLAPGGPSGSFAGGALGLLAGMALARALTPLLAPPGRF